MKKEVLIGLTYGDPAGVGPEILLKTLKNWSFNTKPIIFGSREIFLDKKNLNEFIFYLPKKQEIKVLLGKLSKETGKHSYYCLKSAVEYCLKNRLNSLVTGPVSKEAVSLAGIPFVGQTEAIAKICKISSDNVIMMFSASDLRIALFTRHTSIKDVPSRLKKDKLKSFLLLLNSELKQKFKIKNPRIAVLGLNPHAGENGLFGNEEKLIINPVIDILKSKGLNVFGPFSPDSSLAYAGQNYLCKKKQKYDSYVSFYHDQSLPMFKAIAGFDGVNVTLGLPFLRVSVDHGTAFDIAGKNKASNKGLISAIRFVENLASN